jgi:hypothetical protein
METRDVRRVKVFTVTNFQDPGLTCLRTASNFATSDTPFVPD